MTSLRRGLSAGGALLFLLAGAAPARAQYFGRNAVQWEKLDFEVLKTEHFDIYYYKEGRAAAEQAGRLGERWYARLSRMLDYQLPSRQPLVLYASHPQFQQTNAVGGPPGEGTGGVTEAFKRRIVLPVGASLAETDHVLGHELVHAFQFSITGQGKSKSPQSIGALRMPLWFIEGMAEYLSVGPVDPHTAMWLRDAAGRDDKDALPTIAKLGSGRYFPYRYGQALWAYLATRFTDKVVGEALRRVKPESNDAEGILAEVTGVKADQLSKDWHQAIREAAQPVIAGRKAPDAYGAALVTEKGQGGRVNLGPALSPDGARLAFLSERDELSIELFVQDTGSGEVTRRLSHAVVDPHLESLQFINSAGSWDRAGERVALAAVAKGRPLLMVLEGKSGRKLLEVPFPDLGEMYTPSFSPDGRSVVFAAVANGFTDIFTYDLETKARKRLTSDAHADLQPAWSPDGQTIAFVSDRFSTRLGTLDLGNYRLASIDAAGGVVRELPSFGEGKNINPQWSADGSALYFLSDRNGITNVYRAQVATGEVFQLTDLLGGVSGITPLSPALSSAARADKLAYSVFSEDRYEIYAITGADKLAGWPVGSADTRQAAVIPGAKAAGEVVEARADASTGLADSATFETKPYSRKLGLDYIGRPVVTAGADRYGAFLSGGVSLGFSDMLGNHELGVTLQAGSVSGFTDVGGIVSYINRERRLNWGLQGYQIPYVVGSFGAGVGTDASGRRVYAEQTLFERQLDRGLMAQAIYPLNGSLRVEAGVGYRNLSFETRLQTDTFLLSGQLLQSAEEKLSGSSLDLGEGSLALVRDTSVFGATAPVVGQRLRLDVSPTVGSVSYTGVLADFRQYVMPFRPLTLAGRVMHYGRYGSGASDQRLTSLFLGYPSLVRGYDNGSFSAEECGSDGAVCPTYDRLLGTRLAVANLEARVPLLKLFGARRSYGAFPVDVGGFFDAGVAWDANTSIGDRDLVKSVGAVARANLFGFAVLEVDWVKPLDRPGKGAYFTFNLLGGF